MARAGWEVHVLEKHLTPGGRARQLNSEGFSFDMGPSWYWMPDVFENFFARFGKKVTDYYHLKRLDPSYRVYWKDSVTDIPADYTSLRNTFENIEPGAARQLDKFLEGAAYKYETGIKKLVYKPGQSVKEFLDPALIKGLFKLEVFNSMQSHVARYFQNPRLRQLMEFPVLFLGALPEKTPALYSLMNYADIIGGTWYPEGGIYQVVNALHQLALELGVQFHFGHTVKKISVEKNLVKSIHTESSPENGPVFTTEFTADVVISGADYHHIENLLSPATAKSYPESYWNKRIMAPGCLLYYVGLNKKLNNILHHSLFFDTSFEIHGREIYTTKKWPSDPLFYMSATSVSDPGTAPAGCENLFLLIPVAAGLDGDTEEIREKYFDIILDRLERRLGEKIRPAIIFRKSFGYTDFVNEYNSFKGNAYGLANTLGQTAVLKPSCHSKKVANLFYTGQLTVPGPGVPPALISGEVVATAVLKSFGY